MTPLSVATPGVDLGWGDRTGTYLERWLDGDGPGRLPLSNTGLGHLLKHSIPVGQGSPERLAAAPQQMPAIGNLNSPWSRLPHGLGVGRIAVAADDLNAGMNAQPVLDGCSFAVGQEIHDAATLQVAQDRSIPSALAPGPIVNAEDTGCSRDSQSPALPQNPKQR